MKKLSNKFSISRAAMFCFALLALAFTGCMDKNDTDTPTPVEVSYVNLYHGSPDGPDYNVMLDDEKINNQAFLYANNSGYFKLPAGSHKIAFTPVTATTSQVDITHTFKKDSIYSLFAVGQAANTEILILKDSLIAPVSGSAAIRLVNLSPDAPALDVVIAGAEATPVFTGFGFKGNTQFKNIVSGTYSFKVKATGTDDVLVPATSFELNVGGNYTLIVRGFQTPPSGNTNVLSLQMIRNY
ncbi:DUF4397 domain-containing protein [Pontibacter sp. E15-1]|uniref:DUF4397 domain-containing protein n=1 Tax=Pontibacter sp. E15-1 TaxID=2919918 RepID=UPI001F4FF468|nr:DUF4397 domain-containing protein [Pontibacter sp. E15-1]MCJ8167302.1 DUF4397 domain-containing protein [Pontibacter sp. E15-1]